MPQGRHEPGWRPQTQGLLSGEGFAQNLPQRRAWLRLPVCTNNTEAPVRGQRLFMATHSARLVLPLPLQGSPIPSIPEPLVTGINTPGSVPGTAAGCFGCHSGDSPLQGKKKKKRLKVMDKVVDGGKGSGSSGEGSGGARPSSPGDGTRLLRPKTPPRQPPPVAGCHLVALAQGDAGKGGRKRGKTAPCRPKSLLDTGDVERAKGRLSPAPNTPHSGSFVAGKLGENQVFWTYLNPLSIIWTMRGSRAPL